MLPVERQGSEKCGMGALNELCFSHAVWLEFYHSVIGYSTSDGQLIEFYCPAHTKHLPSGGTGTLSHHLRRWPNIVPILDERLVFAGCAILSHFMLYLCHSIVGYIQSQ